MKQRIVAEDDLTLFYDRCAELLSNGWKVIPSTVRVEVSIETQCQKPQQNNAFVAFFEKEVKV